MIPKFQIWFEDSLDHGTIEHEFDNYEEAKAHYDKCVEIGPEGYEISVELTECIDEHDNVETLEFTEWFTHESWFEAHPWNEKEGVWENVT